MSDNQPLSPPDRSVPSTDRWVRGVDCRLGLRALREHSVSLVLTDPPYFIDGMGDEWDNERLRRRMKGGVVGGIPVGMKFDSRQGQRLQQFLLPVADALLSILKPGGFFLCFSQPRLMHRTAMAIEEAGFEVRDVLGWQYQGQAKAFTQDHFVRRKGLPPDEEAAVLRALGGRKTPQLRPQMELIVLAQSPRQGTFVDNWLAYETGLVDVSDPHIQPDKFPGTLIPCPKPRERHNHMTTKPVDLCRHLIRIFSAPDALVLDPFAGSGTTGVAALQEGRRFLGFEIDSATAAAANQRVEGARYEA